MRFSTKRVEPGIDSITKLADRHGLALYRRLAKPCTNALYPAATKPLYLTSRTGESAAAATGDPHATEGL